MSVFVVDTNKVPLAPCHEAKARKLLDAGKAAIWRMRPFTIILKLQSTLQRFPIYGSSLIQAQEPLV